MAKKRTLKNLGRKGLSLLLAAVMTTSLIQISAFATGGDAEASAPAATLKLTKKWEGVPADATGTVNITLTNKDKATESYTQSVTVGEETVLTFDALTPGATYLVSEDSDSYQCDTEEITVNSATSAGFAVDAGRQTPCANQEVLVQLEGTNYLVASKGQDFLVWTYHELETQADKDEFVKAFQSVAEGPFQGIPGKSIEFIFGNQATYGDETVTVDADKGTVTFSAKSNWSQVMVGNYEPVYTVEKTTAEITNTCISPVTPIVPATLDIVKVDKDHYTTGLSGAMLALFDKATDVDTATKAIKYATSDKDGKLSFTFTKGGSYYVREVVAPEGYELSDAFWHIVVTQDGNKLSADAFLGCTGTESALTGGTLFVPNVKKDDVPPTSPAPTHKYSVVHQ